MKNNYNDLKEETESISKEIQFKIIKKTGKTPLVEIAQKMGYNNLKKGVNRIKKVMEEPGLGLFSPNYDGVYSSELFLNKLIETIELKDESVTKNLKEINELITDSLYGYSPHIFYDTNFVRGKTNSAPIFVMAAIQNWRYINLPKYIKRKSRNEQLNMVRQVIRWHQSEKKGEIDFWGTVAKYVCHFDKEDVVKFLPDGSIIEEIKKEVKHGGAKLMIGNKIIAGEGSDSSILEI